MATRVFISFDYDNDERLKILLVGQARNPDSPFEIADWSIKEASSQWRAEAKDKMKRCDAVVVIVGAATHRATGVLIEIDIAKELRDTDGQALRVFGIRPQSQPNNKTPDSITVYSWTWDNLKKLLA